MINTGSSPGPWVVRRPKELVIQTPICVSMSYMWSLEALRLALMGCMTSSFFSIAVSALIFMRSDHSHTVCSLDYER